MRVNLSLEMLKFGEEGVSTDCRAKLIRVAMGTTLTHARPNMEMPPRGRACYENATSACPVLKQCWAYYQSEQIKVQTST
jgi:hypothetical protein